MVPDPSKRMLELFELSHGPVHPDAWGVKLRRRFGYFTPNEYYEAVIEGLVNERTTWLDVGGGHHIFPANPVLSRILADRCAHLMVVDPSPNIETNQYAREKFKGFLEEIPGTPRFSLATARMVVEHVADPEAFVGKLAQVVLPGGKVVLYTVSRWSPVTILSSVTPTSFHARAKKLLWQSREEDTFPVQYRMNTRARLDALFGAAGFRRTEFLRLDDCRTLARWRSTFVVELALWLTLRRLGLGYPEACLLGVYQKM